MLDMKVLDYRISSDSNQVVLSKVRRDENGDIVIKLDSDGSKKESRNILGYYSNLSKALRKMRSDHVLSEGTAIKTIEEYKTELEFITQKAKEELNIMEDF